MTSTASNHHTTSASSTLAAPPGATATSVPKAPWPLNKHRQTPQHRQQEESLTPRDAAEYGWRLSFWLFPQLSQVNQKNNTTWSEVFRFWTHTAGANGLFSDFGGPESARRFPPGICKKGLGVERKLEARFRGRAAVGWKFGLVFERDKNQRRL